MREPSLIDRLQRPQRPADWMSVTLTAGEVSLRIWEALTTAERTAITRERCDDLAHLILTTKETTR